MFGRIILYHLAALGLIILGIVLICLSVHLYDIREGWLMVSTIVGSVLSLGGGGYILKAMYLH